MGQWGPDTYVLRLSGISRKSAALIRRYSQKKECISIVFYWSENPSIACNLRITEPIQVGFSAKCTSPNERFNQIANWKCHICNFRLIPLDRITYNKIKLQEPNTPCFSMPCCIFYSFSGAKSTDICQRARFDPRVSIWEPVLGCGTKLHKKNTVIFVQPWIIVDYFVSMSLIDSADIKKKVDKRRPVYVTHFTDVGATCWNGKKM